MEAELKPSQTAIISLSLLQAKLHHHHPMCSASVLLAASLHWCCMLSDSVPHCHCQL